MKLDKAKEDKDGCGSGREKAMGEMSYVMDLG